MKKILLVISILLFVTISFGQNQNISNGIVFDGEPYLSVNPYNPQHMVVAWMGWVLFNKIAIKTRVTFDGGSNWSDEVHLSHTVSSYTSADPSIEFDHNGDVFLSYIDFTGFNTFPLDGAVYVCKSGDGGLNWGAPVEVISFDSDPGKLPIDRPWISIDRSGGNNQGNIYITTMNAKGATIGYNPYFISSTDGGNTFNQWRYLDTTNWIAGYFIPQPMPTPCLSSNGTFYAIYPSLAFLQNPLAQFIIATSHDAGNSFTYNSVFESETGVMDSLAKKGYLLRSDPADTSHLAFFYLDTIYGDIDVFMRESFDVGVTWSDATRINDDPVSNNRMQDLVWADFDNDGDLVVSWRDRRNAPDPTYTTDSEIWGAVRMKDSTNFSDNFRLSNTIVVYDSILAQSGNDFMCVKFVDDTINAVWGDTRTGKLNIWFQRTTTDGALVSISQIASENIPLVSIFPNPTVSDVTIEGKNIKEVTVFNQAGIFLSTNENLLNSNNLKIDLSALPDGVYLFQIITKDGVVTRKVVK